MGEPYRTRGSSQLSRGIQEQKNYAPLAQFFRIRISNARSSSAFSICIEIYQQLHPTLILWCQWTPIIIISTTADTKSRCYSPSAECRQAVKLSFYRKFSNLKLKSGCNRSGAPGCSHCRMLPRQMIARVRLSAGCGGVLTVGDARTG